MSLLSALIQWLLFTVWLPSPRRLPFLPSPLLQRPEWAMSPASSSSSLSQMDGPGASSSLSPSPSAAALSVEALMRDRIVLAACGAEEALPQSPELPADCFTACLTTPIKMALTWWGQPSTRHSMSTVTVPQW